MTAPSAEDPTRVAMDRAPEPTEFFAPGAQPLASGPLPPPPSIFSRLIYAALVVIPAILIVLVLLVQEGLLPTQARAGKTPWDLGILIASALVVVGIASLVARQAPEALRRSRSVAALDAGIAKWELRVVGASLAFAAALLVLSFLAWSGVLRALGPVTLGPMGAPILATVAMFVTCAPVGYFSHMRARQIKEFEDRFPDFLRDLNESYGAGLTMAQAIRVASRGDYGKLNPELRRMANQVSWGTPFPEALRMFGERVGTPIVTRAVALIIKATRAGGNAKDVLSAASRDAREIMVLQSERRTSMTLYVIVIYVAFGVFLGVVAALQGLLVPALLASTHGAAGSTGSIAGLATNTSLGVIDFRFIYFSVGLVQAVGSGIVAGVMAEGSYSAGLKHAAVMIVLSLVVLGVLL